MTQPSELGTHLSSTILAHHAAFRICEFNPTSLELAASILKLTSGKAQTAVYHSIPYDEHPERPPWPPEREPIRVLHPSLRTFRGAADKILGVCDTLIVRAEAELTALRASVVHDIPLLVQHAAPNSLIAMHGVRCVGNRNSMEYRGPFWVGNLSVPCWQDAFETLAAAGALSQANCRSFALGPSSTPDAGEASRDYLLCTAIFRANASACGTQQPLLERWAGGQTTSSCAVRKEPVALQGSTIAWTRSRWHGAGRQSLSHMFRRHMRYYSAMPCDGQICLLFKNEVDEDWVAGLNSSDGILFRGDPMLVLPKNNVRAQLFNTLRAMRPLGDYRQREPTPQEVPWKLRGSRENTKCLVVGDVACTGGPFGRSFEAMISAMTHNLALTMHKGEWLAIGGRHNRMRERLGRSALVRENKAQKTRVSVDGWWKSTVALLQKKQPNWPHLVPPSGLLLRLCPGCGKQPEKEDPARTITKAFGPHVLKQIERLPAAHHPITRRGLWLMRSKTWRYEAPEASWLNNDGEVDEPPESPWAQKRLVLDGHHPGCVERRNTSSRDMDHVIPGVCEFDGRLSLVSFRGDLLLFSRSNPAAHGSRHVQVTRSANDGDTWSPFEQLRLSGYDGGGDIYFFGVQVNPAHDQSLLAIFPLVHRMRGCVAMSASLDGVRWTRATPLLSCSIYGERTLDHPASPAMVQRGSEVWLYVHEEVPGITIDRVAPRLVYANLAKAERPSNVVRYAFSCKLLAAWTADALQEWRASYAPVGTSASSSFQSSCSASTDAPPKPPPQFRVAKPCSWSPRVPNTAHSRVPQPQPPPRKAKPMAKAKRKTKAGAVPLPVK